MDKYHTKKPGDILFLEADLPSAPAGFYVLLDSHMDLVRLSHLGIDSETDNLVTTPVEVEVPIADLCLFETTGMEVESNEDSETYEIGIGAIIEPKNDQVSLPIGLYQVIEIDSDDLLVSRLHSNEDGNLGTTARKSWIARTELGLYRRLRGEGIFE